MRNVFIVFLAVVGLIRCDTPSREGLFRAGRVLGVNKNHDLEETSGLVASARYPGLFWAHNDGGHPPALFLLDSTGNTVRSFRIIGAKNRDWEGIAIGPGPDSASTLFIGDIGDNRQKKPVKYVYCIREPDKEGPEELTVDKTIMIRAKDRPRDAEALLMDPLSRNLYIVTKMEKEIRLYEIPFPYPDSITADPIEKLPLRYITAGDISADGSEIILKSYSAVYYWKRNPGRSVAQTLLETPVDLDYVREPQGEAIAWAHDGSGFYTLSENGKGERGKLIFYARSKRDSTTTKR